MNFLDFAVVTRVSLRQASRFKLLHDRSPDKRHRRSGATRSALGSPVRLSRPPAVPPAPGARNGVTMPVTHATSL